MDLPKVNIAVAASAVVAIVSTVGGGIWYASSQASIIEGLTEQVETLTIENNATDRTNLIRDVEENTERIDEIIDYIIEVEEDGGETIDRSVTRSAFESTWEGNARTRLPQAWCGNKRRAYIRTKFVYVDRYGVTKTYV